LPAGQDGCSDQQRAGDDVREVQQRAVDQNAAEGRRARPAGLELFIDRVIVPALVERFVRQQQRTSSPSVAVINRFE
jgi:hypothetical protein